jgi:hypothetical protein
LQPTPVCIRAAQTQKLIPECGMPSPALAGENDNFARLRAPKKGKERS